MLTEDEKQKLINAGYTHDEQEKYYFKVKKEWGYRKYTYSAVFINKFTKVASFEGSYDFRQELKNEANSLIGGLIWRN